MSAERLKRMTDEELGGALRAIEPMLLQPPPPDVTRAVMATIRSEGRPRSRLSSRARTVILIAAALLLIATAAAAAKLVIDLGGIRIEREPTLTGTPTTTSSPIAGVALGRSVTLAEATAAAGFTPVVPRELGPPDRVWLTSGGRTFDQPDTVLVAMAWLPRPGLPRIPGTPFGASLIEVRGEADVLVKHVAAPFDELATHAYWIHTPHEVELLTRDGTRVFPVTGNVLVWQRGALALRLEMDLARRAALRLAGLARR